MATLGALAVALCAAIIAVVVARAAPRATFLLWMATMFFVPVWVGVSVGPFWSAITLVTVLLIAACAQRGPLSIADAFMAGFAILVGAQFALGISSLSATFIAASEWLLPYIVGRVLLARVSIDFVTKAIAVVAVIAALLALVEASTGVNVFQSWPAGSASLYDQWSPLQPRGGLVRAEGAFGHSIALGATLSMSAAFVLASRWRLGVRIAMLAVIAGAVAMTLSRIGLVTLVITVGLSLLVLPGLSARGRVAIAAAAIVAAAVVVPFISDVFLDAGGEAGGSADYRFDLLAITRVVPLFGSAPDIGGLTIDGQFLGVFEKSIDNAILVVAMRVGWVPTVLLLGVLVVAVSRLFARGRTHSAAVAVAGQLPGLLAVSLITQYAVFFWFVVGLAVTLNLRAAHRDDPSFQNSREVRERGRTEKVQVR
ncbi:hypothetical protein GCM10009796_17690 [Microbacterium koreense]